MKRRFRKSYIVEQISTGETCKKIRIYPTFLYRRLDRWLKEMSRKGWHIVHCGVFSFWFERGECEEREYFTYGLGTQEGKYSISLRYSFLEKTYGLKKSRINANPKKSYQIVEIDPHKIADHGYQELIRDRDRLYLRYFVRNLLAIGVASLIALALYVAVKG